MSGESPTGDDAAGPPPGESGGAALGLNLDARLPPHVVVDTMTPPVDEELRLHRREAEVATEAPRRAVLVHEAGQLLEHSFGDEAGAVTAYSRALSEEPGLAPNLWALRRLAERGGSWDEVVKLLDAEVSFGASLGPADRADLLVERGRILEDRLGRDDEAAASYRSALTACPDHPAALLALLLLAARTADGAGIEAALAGLTRRSLDAGRRACWAVELARAQRTGGDPAGIERAFDTLQAALGSTDGAPAPLMREMARLIPTEGSGALRLRVLEELLRRPSEDAPGTAALLREKARLLATVGRDPEGAVVALKRALDLTPAHPLLWRELAEAADRAGRPEIVAEMNERRVVEPGLHAALALRHAEALARSGRTHEALAILDGTPGLAQHDFQVWAARIRFLAIAGDAAGLASAFNLEAELARRGEHARWTRAEPDAETRARDAAEALLRSAALKDFVLRDEAAAEASYRAALASSPHLRPAVDALERMLTTGGRWSELADLLGSELDTGAAAGSETDPARIERRAYLLESLVAVLRDRLNDPRAARPRQAQLDEMQGRDLRSQVRTVDLDLRLLAEAEPDATVGPGADALLDLRREATGPVAQAALQLEAARSAARAGDLAMAEDLARQAAELDGSGLGAAAVEALQQDVDRRLEAVVLELNAAERRGDAAAVRGLRFRAAFIEAAAGRLGAAVDTMAPLRAESDAVAVAWSDELARRSGDPDVLISLLLEAGSDAEPERLVALGEALEARGLAGDAATAASHFEEAMLSAASTDAALGLLRQRTASGDVTGVLAALRCAAEASPPELAEALEREAERVVLASAPESHAAATRSAAPGDPEHDVASWLSAARRRDTGELAQAHLAMAAHLSDTPAGRSGSARAAAMTRGLARARLGGAAAALAAYERVRASSAEPGGVGWLLTDLQGELAATPELDELRRQRAERATGSFRSALLLDLAWSAERQGRLRDAAATYGRLLADDACDVSALEGLRRIAEASKDRLGEARVLARLGATSSGGLQRTQLFHRAAMRYEECGHAEEAVALHWRTLEESPHHDLALARLHELLARSGDAAGVERLLGFRLTHERASQARVALYWERARNRLDGLHDRRLAAQDLHRILAIVPYHTEAIRLLAQLCVDAGAHARAAELLERYLQVEADTVLRNDARLVLAAVYQTLGDLDSAITALSDAVEARTDDLQARERLAELYVNVGQWRAALDLLRDMERRAPDPRAAADVKLRIALILREQQDMTGAVELLREAAELDPLGDAPRELLALTDEMDDAGVHEEATELALGGVRRTLRIDPLDATALHQLRAVAKVAGQEDAATVAAQLLALIGETPSPAASPARALRRLPAGAIAAHLTHPTAGGFLSEIWPQLCGAAWEMDLVTVNRDVFSRASRVAPGTERLAWLNAAAQALDIGEVALHVGSVGENEIVAVDHPTPSLAVGTAALRGDPAMRFKIGRALMLLRQRAAVLDALHADRLAQLIAAAGVVAGAPGDGSAAPADLVRLLGRVLGRKEKKSLVLETERFAMARDVANWQNGVLRTADRAGLLVCGDLGAAVRAAAGLEGRVTRTELRDQRRAMDLIDWALGPGYLTLRREAGLVES